jgi:hypothetical protein
MDTIADATQTGTTNGQELDSRVSNKGPTFTCTCYPVVLNNSTAKHERLRFQLKHQTVAYAQLARPTGCQTRRVWSKNDRFEPKYDEN